MRVFESGKTYEYEGLQTSTGVLEFLENQAYRTSTNVIDLAKKTASDTFSKVKKDVKETIKDAKETLSKAKKEVAAPVGTLWGIAKNFLGRVFSVRTDSYLGAFVEWLFKSFGFGSLSLSTKLVGFFMIVVAPLLLVLMMVVFPSAGDEKVPDRLANKNRQVFRENVEEKARPASGSASYGQKEKDS